MQSLDTPLRLPTLVALLTLMTACSGPATQPADQTDAKTGDGTAMVPAIDSLVTAQWLAEHLGEPDLVVIDCTVVVDVDAEGRISTRSGQADFAAGHIPSAAFADLTGALADPDSKLDYAVPSPERFAQVMGDLGVGDDTRVVLYDANFSSWAARVWWMLRWIGFDNAALLDGGLSAWTAAGQPLSTEAATPTPRTLSVHLRPGLIADSDEVLAAIGDEEVALIDAMPAAHYRGEMVMYARPGHITSASNVPALSLLAEDGRFRADDELQALFSGGRDGRAITYCGGGIAASSNAFVMTRLGYTDVAVYTASLQEWTADPANPMSVAADSEAQQ